MTNDLRKKIDYSIALLRKVEVPHGYALIAMNRSSVATSTDAMRRVGLTPKANTPKGTLVVGACVVDEEELFNQATERGKGGFGSTNK